MKITSRVLFISWCVIWLLIHILFIDLICDDYVTAPNTLYWNQSLGLIYTMYLSTFLHLWYNLHHDDNHKKWFAFIFIWCIVNLLNNIIVFIYNDNPIPCSMAIVFSEEIIWLLLSIIFEIAYQYKKRKEQFDSVHNGMEHDITQLAEVDE